MLAFINSSGDYSIGRKPSIEKKRSGFEMGTAKESFAILGIQTYIIHDQDIVLPELLKISIDNMPVQSKQTILLPTR